MLRQALSYVKRHGGGTIAVSSQSSAISAIIGQGASVAGIGGFSGRESSVSVAWLAREVRSGRIRWVLSDRGAAAGWSRLPGDTRAGSRSALGAAARACRKVSLPASAGTSTGAGTNAAGTGTLYDCKGRAAMLSG
jgi:hypothetical protein